jgi:hypothetical protein
MANLIPLIFGVPLKYLFFCLFAWISSIIFCQKDTMPFTNFKDNFIYYNDLGYTMAPFSMKYDFQQDIDKIKYKHNFNTLLGFGFSYKWAALRIGSPLPGSIRSEAKYGKTSQFDVGANFTIKKMHFDVDFRNYRGYAVRNADLFIDTLNNLRPNDIRRATNVFNISISSWYFNNKDLKMDAVKGRTGHYNEQVMSWYIKSSLAVFGVQNRQRSILPEDLIDSTNTKTGTRRISSFDIGIIPGFAYVNRIKNWQFSIMTGLGGAFQLKSYEVQRKIRGFIGVIPRYDIRFIVGYSVPSKFIFFETDFDNKAIQFSDFVYQQNFYTIRIVGGFRFVQKKKKKK